MRQFKASGNELQFRGYGLELWVWGQVLGLCFCFNNFVGKFSCVVRSLLRHRGVGLDLVKGDVEEGKRKYVLFKVFALG